MDRISSSSNTIGFNSKIIIQMTQIIRQQKKKIFLRIHTNKISTNRFVDDKIYGIWRTKPCKQTILKFNQNHIWIVINSIKSAAFGIFRKSKFSICRSYIGNAHFEKRVLATVWTIRWCDHMSATKYAKAHGPCFPYCRRWFLLHVCKRTHTHVYPLFC